MPLDLNCELKKVDDNHYFSEMEIGEMILNNYAKEFEEKLTAEILDRCERKLNELGWYKQPEKEPDSIEKIKNDAIKPSAQYWNCGNVHDCTNCPSKIDDETPSEYYRTCGCLEAMKLDLIERTMKVTEGK